MSGVVRRWDLCLPKRRGAFGGGLCVHYVTPAALVSIRLARTNSITGLLCVDSALCSVQVYLERDGIDPSRG
jgi:hypothetical protein